MIANDPTMTGVTLITPDGEISYISGEVLRLGGRA
jgi:hypothetical protein